MTIAAPDILAVLRRSYGDPSGAVTDLFALGLPRAAVWQALVLMAVLNVLLLAIAAPPPAEVEGAVVSLSPFALAILFVAAQVAVAFGVALAGRSMGGTGNFDRTLLVLTWLDAMAMPLRAATVLLGYVSPALAAITSLATFGFMFWVLLHFIRALHGFATLGRAFLAILLAILGTGLALGLLAVALGIDVSGVA